MYCEAVSGVLKEPKITVYTGPAEVDFAGAAGAGFAGLAVAAEAAGAAVGVAAIAEAGVWASSGPNKYHRSAWPLRLELSQALSGA